MEFKGGGDFSFVGEAARNEAAELKWVGRVSSVVVEEREGSRKETGDERTTGLVQESRLSGVQGAVKAVLEGLISVKLVGYYGSGGWDE